LEPFKDLIYRETTEEEKQLVEDRNWYAFEPTKYYDRKEIKEPELEEARGLFSGDELLCSCVLCPVEARLRGRRVPLGAVSAVASPPENRRRGYIAEMLRRSFQEMRERGIYLSTLWPFYYGFYEKLGWALSSEELRYSIGIKQLQTACGSQGGRYFPVDLDGYEVLKPIYEAWAETYDLTWYRRDDWWQNRVINRWGSKPFVYRWQDDAGATRGYVIFSFKDTDSGRQLRVWELVYSDFIAHKALLHLLSLHDSQVKKVKLSAPVDDPLLQLVSDPRDAVETKLSPGQMTRVVDVRAAVEAQGSDLRRIEGEFSLEVQDSHCTWNNGVFAITVSGGSVVCSGPVDASDSQADISLTINGFSKAYTGYRTVSQLAAFDQAAVNSKEALVIADALWPRTKPFMIEEY